MSVAASWSSGGAPVSLPVVVDKFLWSVTSGSLWSLVVIDGTLWSVGSSEVSPSGIWSRDAAGFVGE